MAKAIAYFLILLTIRQVDVQYMPMWGHPPMVAMPPPPALLVSIDSCEKKTTTTTTTTTTQRPRSMAVAVPVPVPLPVQVALPAYPAPAFCYTQPVPRGCPPCPPCQCQPMCTPSFFSYCSPCHLKCRCKNGDSVPVPLPPMAPQPVPGPAYALPAPMAPYNPNIMIVPYPPVIRPSQDHSQDFSPSTDGSSYESDSSDYDSESDSYTDSSDSGEYLRQGRNRERNNNKKHKKKKQMKLRGHRRRKLEQRQRNGHKDKLRHKHKDPKQKKHKKIRRKNHKVHRGVNNFRFNRRSFGDTANVDNRLVKPVLSYVASNGDVKLQKTISSVDAKRLLDDKQDIQRATDLSAKTINVSAKENSNGQTQVVVVSSDNLTYKREGQHVPRRMIHKKLEAQRARKELGVQNARKELHFKPPEDKRITNLSLSFQIV